MVFGRVSRLYTSKMHYAQPGKPSASPVGVIDHDQVVLFTTTNSDIHRANVCTQNQTRHACAAGRPPSRSSSHATQARTHSHRGLNHFPASPSPSPPHHPASTVAATPPTLPPNRRRCRPNQLSSPPHPLSHPAHPHVHPHTHCRRKARTQLPPSPQPLAQPSVAVAASTTCPANVLFLHRSHLPVRPLLPPSLPHELGPTTPSIELIELTEIRAYAVDVGSPSHGGE
jgi:hypothetical protein